MKPQIHLVLISVSAFVILLTALLIYRFVFPRKKVHPLALVLLLSLLPLVSLLRPGSYESGDLSLHTMRTISFYKILFIEHQLPRWTPEFNVGYGDPYFLFAYFLPYFIGAVFHFVGFSFLTSIKLLLASSFILSGISMYYWIKEELSERAAIVSAIFYLYVPYHLVDLHFRVTIAETLSFVFLPPLLLFAKKTIISPRIKYVVFGGICYSLLILTHQIIALSFSPILVIYSLFIWAGQKKKTFKQLFSYGLSLFFGLLLSAFYWVPIIVESKYTQASLTKSLSFFISLPELLYSPWRYGLLFQGHYGELSFITGYTQLFVILACFYLLITSKIKEFVRLQAYFFLILFFLLIFLMLPIAEPIWLTVPLLHYFQFSYRLLELAALCTSFLAGVVAYYWRQQYFLFILCSLTILYTILNWGNRRNLPYVNDTYLINYFQKHPDVGMYLEPSSPIWADLNKSKLREWPKNHIEVISGSAKIGELSRSSIERSYRISASTPLVLKENTLYFPGWRVLVDGIETTIDYKNKKYPGIILFSLKPGRHNVEIRFENTPDRAFSQLVSLTTATLSALTLIFVFLRRYFARHSSLSLFSNNTNIPRPKRYRKIGQTKKVKNG